MGKRKASSRSYSFALLACVAIAWSRLGFPAALPNQPAASSSVVVPSTTSSITTPGTTQGDAAVDSQPEAAVDFLGGVAGKETPGSKKGDASDAPAQTSIFPSLRFAPIAMRVSGTVGYSLSRQSSDTAPTTIQEMLTTSLDVYATSYIWKPWFAKVEGQVGYTNAVAASSRGGSGNNNVPLSSVSGEAKLRLFPVSRYPFEASLRQSESFVGYLTGVPDTQTKSLRLGQNYTPRDRKEQYRALLTRTIAGGMNLPKDREDMLNVSADSKRFDKQTHELTGDSVRTYGSKNRVTLNNRLVSRHDYKPTADFSLNGLGNVNYFSAKSFQTAQNVTNMQLSSTASWRPQGQPYYLMSTLRAVGANSAVNGRESASLQGVFATLSGAYTVNQYLNLSATGTYFNVVSNGKRNKKADLSSGQSAAVNYPLPSINFGDFRYTRGIGAQFSNQANTTAAPSRQSVTVSPRHALARNMKWMGGGLGLNLTQGLTLGKASRAPENASLNHQGRANWSRVDGKKTSAVSLSATDQRTLLGQKSNAQMINLQGTLNTELDRNSSWDGNLTVQTARSGDAQLMSPWIASSSASLGYRNQRMFNINRMVFKSNLRITSKSLLPVLADSAKEPGERAWDNRLTYTLGRLELSLTGNITQAQKQTSTFIMFNATRSFGRR